MHQNNVVRMRAPKPAAARSTRYASVGDTFSIEALIGDLDDGAITGSGDYDLTIDTYVTARTRRAA